MKIMVFDVPAVNGGALSVLNEFYDQYKMDKENEYYFIVSLPELKEQDNIKVLRFPWIKKNWINRIYFDNFIAPKLIKRYSIDKVLSLQNIIIPHTTIWQTVYIHNSLPFSEYRFSFLKHRVLWIYQNILSRKIYKSIKKAKEVIVQTEWMKKAIINKLHVNESKIKINPIEISFKVKKYFVKSEESYKTFFYPASGVEFKNHRVIVDACLLLQEKNICNYKVIFTLYGNENKHITKLLEIIKKNNLPIDFVGSLKIDEVFDYYTKSILIFPSYIETVGLPLIEASLHKTPIIVSNCEFSAEILKNYENKFTFNPFDSKKLANLLKQFIVG
ncbi:MAG: glycosyltransferase [Firmicutes bacterium]|nr:glycosyltransferase [Bacillota bacterium]